MALDIVEITRELEWEEGPEDVTEVLQFYDKTYGWPIVFFVWMSISGNLHFWNVNGKGIGQLLEKKSWILLEV